MKLINATNRINDYSKHKNGWVKFNGGKKKVKLRKFIDDFARKMVGWGVKHSEARDFLISYYEMDGVKGIVRAYSLAGNERINQLKKEQDDLRNKIGTGVDEEKEDIV